MFIPTWVITTFTIMFLCGVAFKVGKWFERAAWLNTMYNSSAPINHDGKYYRITRVEK